jgi:hypothetical protein
MTVALALEAFARDAIRNGSRKAVQLLKFVNSANGVRWSANHERWINPPALDRITRMARPARLDRAASSDAAKAWEKSYASCPDGPSQLFIIIVIVVFHFIEVTLFIIGAG